MRVINSFKTPSEMVQTGKRTIDLLRRQKPELQAHVVSVVDEATQVWVVINWDVNYGYYNIQFHFKIPNSKSTKISRRDAEKKFGVADANWW